MKKTLFLVGLLAAFAASAQQATYYQIDLVPTGKMLSKDQPVLRGSTYLFHSYPNGTLMSLRRSEVKLVTQVTPELTNPNTGVIQIGTLAMQGGSTQAGPKNASTVKAKSTGQQLGEGFYSNLKMGESLAEDAGRSGDYTVGKDYAYAPASASQSSPGAPPTAPGATNGQAPPMMPSNPQ